MALRSVLMWRHLSYTTCFIEVLQQCLEIHSFVIKLFRRTACTAGNTNTSSLFTAAIHTGAELRLMCDDASFKFGTWKGKRVALTGKVSDGSLKPKPACNFMFLSVIWAQYK